MSIMVYTGVMGSGKTYEGVSTAALTALRKGRRVVTNISGFNYSAIRDYLGELEDGSRLEPEQVVVIQSKRITEPNFFYDPEAQEDTVVRPGDLVLIDEVWAFWGTDAKLSAEHQKFFRMHRHYVEAGSGVACDLVIMIQDLTSLHRFVRGVVESTFKFTKLKALGLFSRYRVEVYEGNRQRRATLVSTSVKKYDKAIFPLYQSYDGGTGSEAVVDGRQNLFNSKWFLFSMVLGVALTVGGGWWFFNYWMYLRSGGDQQTAKQSPQAGKTDSRPQAQQRPLTAGAVAPVQVTSGVRLAGVIEHQGGEHSVIFQLADGAFVRQRMDSGQVAGWATKAGFEGQMVGFKMGVKLDERSK